MNINDEVSNIQIHNETSEKSHFLSKFGNLQIEVPTVLIKKLETYDKQPWKDNKVQLGEYFNYGFNEKTWNLYVEKMQLQMKDLEEKVKQGKMLIKEDPKVKKYIQNFPLNYGGLGDYTENNNHINYFEYIRKHNPPNIEIKNFIPYVTIPNKDSNSNMNQGFHLLMHNTSDGIKIIEDKKEKRRASYDRYDDLSSHDKNKKGYKRDYRERRSRDREREKERRKENDKYRHRKSRSNSRSSKHEENEKIKFKKDRNRDRENKDKYKR